MSARCFVSFFAFTLACLTVVSHAATSVLVNHSNPWHYHKGTNAPQSDWTFVAAEDLGPGWLIGPGGIGYSDGDDATVLADMRNFYTTVFIRQEFTVPGSF